VRFSGDRVVVAQQALALQALDQSAFSSFLRQHWLAYPAIEATHIVGLSLVVGGMLIVDVAVLRGRGQALAKQVLGFVLAGFGIALITGCLMVIARPLDLVLNPVLWIKFGMIALAGTNAAVLHVRAGLEKLDALTKAQAGLSAVLWIAVVFAGRWIAYV
jgi:hypothetical protein